MVDAGEGGVVRDGLERRPGSVPVRGGRHFPAELYGRLVDPSLAAALLHEGVFGEVGVTGSDADEGVAWGRGFLSTLLGHFFHAVVVSQGDDLCGGERAALSWG